MTDSFGYVFATLILLGLSCERHFTRCPTEYREVGNQCFLICSTDSNCAANETCSKQLCQPCSQEFCSEFWDTPLGILARDMSEMSWAELSTQNFDVGDLVRAAGGGTTIDNAASAVWDPFRKQVRFVGSQTNINPPITRFIVYDDASNSWSIETHPFTGYSSSYEQNGYDHNAIDPQTGFGYLRVTNQPLVLSYEPSTKSWFELPPIPATVYDTLQISGGTAFFPELGGLVYVNGPNVVAFWNQTTNAWNQIERFGPATSTAMGTYSTFAEYNPKQHLVLFGGGSNSNHLYKLDSSGAITTLNPAPVSGLQTPSGGADASAHVVYEPRSGRFLILTNGGTFYEYDPQTDVWTTLTGVLPVAFSGNVNVVSSSISVPVTSYGVTMWIVYRGSDSAVLLYKHRGQ